MLRGAGPPILRSSRSVLEEYEEDEDDQHDDVKHEWPPTPR